MKMNKILEEYIKSGCVGDLDLSRSNIKRLPDNLEVGGNLSLTDCKNLTSLGDNLEVGGYLSLYGCENLTSIGDNLEVGGILDLEGCKNLTSIGDNLKVGGILDLRRSNIKTLPPTLEVKGDIYVDTKFNVNPYRKEILFIKAMEGEQVPTIGGEIKVKVRQW